MRRRLATLLRNAADRLDPSSAFRATHLVMRFETGKGIVVGEGFYGCRLWYRGRKEFEKAHAYMAAIEEAAK